VEEVVRRSPPGTVIAHYWIPFTDASELSLKRTLKATDTSLVAGIQQHARISAYVLRSELRKPPGKGAKRRICRPAGGRMPANRPVLP
jgi:hypothetical protein